MVLGKFIFRGSTNNILKKKNKDELYREKIEGKGVRIKMNCIEK